MEENKKQLYDFLVGEGLFEGTDKSFDSMYSDDDGINFLYKSLSETGYYQGSDKDFRDQFFTPKKKDLTWSQDFGKAYESMPQGSPTKTKSVTTPSASTSPKEKSFDPIKAGLQIVSPIAGLAFEAKNAASEKELKAEERFVNYTNAIGNINKRIESMSKAGEALVGEYNGLAQEMQSLNEVMQSKLRPQAEKTQASLRAKQVQDRAALIEQELGQMKSSYQTDVDRKNTLFRAALAQKAIVSNEVEDNFSLLQDFNRKLIGLSVKSIGQAIEGIGDLAFMAQSPVYVNRFGNPDDKITDEIGDNIATAGAEVYDQALKRIPESAQWDPEKGLSALTPMKTAVFATNAIASTMPSVFAALSGSKAATITTSAVMNYGDAYSTARQRGFDEDKAVLVAAAITPLVTALDQFGLDQILKGSKGAFSQFVKTETLKRLAGKELTKDAIFAVTSKVFSEGLKRFGKTAGKITLTEVPTEAMQGAIQEAGIQLADKQKIDWTKLGYATEAEALGGFFGAGAMSVIPGVQAFMFNPTAYSIAMGTNNPEFAADLQDLIKSEIAAGSLTEEEAAEIAQNIETIKETDKVIPNTVNNKAARVEAINLVNEKNRLKAEMEGMDPAMVLDKKERIGQIDELLTNISLTNLPTNEQTTNTDNATGAGSPNTQTGTTGSTTTGGDTSAGGQTPGSNAVDNSPEAVESRRAQIRKDMEIEAFQERTGFKLYDPFEMMPPVVEVTLGRLAEGNTVDPVAIKEASDWLYGEYKRLDAMKQADNRTMTIPQIEEIQSELEGEITALENEYNYAEQQKTEAGATVGQGDQQTEGTPGETQEVNGTITQDDQGGEAATATEPEVTEPTQEGTGSTQEAAQNPEPDKFSDESVKYAQDRGVTAPHALSILNKYLPNWRSYPSQEKALDAAFRIQAAKKATNSQASKFKLIAKNPKLMLAVRAINRTFAALGVKSLILNDSDFNSIHESISGQKGSGKLRNAFYDPMTKTMYLKSSNIAQTAFHEVIHPFLESIRTSDKEVYDKIIDRVRNMEAIKPDSGGKTYFDWAKSYYPDRSEYIQDQEAVTEFMADVLGDNVSFTDLLKGEALAVLNDILKYFGYNGTLTKPVSIKFVMENVPNIETIVTKAVANARIFEFEEASTEGEVRDQIVGEKARLDEQTRQNKVIAQEMEDAGKDAKTIRMATGWEKGVDGKWRYEVEDDYKLVSSKKIPSKLSDIISNKKLFSLYPDLKDVSVRVRNFEYVDFEAKYNPDSEEIQLSSYLFEDEELLKQKVAHEVQHFIQIKEGWKPLDNEAIDKMAGEIPGLKLSSPYSDVEDNSLELLEDVLDDMKRKYKTISDLINGDPSGNEINAVLYYYDEPVPSNVKGVTSVDVNGFVYRLGGDYLNTKEDIIKGIYDKLSSLYERNNVDSIELAKKELVGIDAKSERAEDLRFIIDITDRYEAAINSIKGGDYEVITGKLSPKGQLSFILNDRYGPNYSEVTKKADIPFITEAILEQASENSKDRWDIYNNAQSEVEARNVESRMNMTPEQRRNTLLSETEDVNREDQIIRDQMSNGDFGYHGGNLKEKSDYLTTRYRGDMPFTGYYFFSDKKRAKERGNRRYTTQGNDIRIVDFSKYNLLKPTTSQYWAAKFGLKKFEDNFLRYGIDAAFESLGRQYGLKDGYPKLYEQLVDNRSKIEEVAKDWLENDLNNLDNKEEIERLETRMLKALGYEGVDVRGLKEENGDASPDTSSEGSVIFDLKPRTILDENQEIMDQLTPRRTLEENNIATAKEQEAIEAAANYMQDSADMDELVAEYAAKTDHAIETIISRKTKLTDEGAEDIFAYAEAINRAQSSPDRKFYGRTIPELMTKVAPIGTFAAKVLRFMQLISKPNAKAQTEALIALIENKGYVLSPAQKAELLRRNTDIKNARDAVKAAKENFLNVGTVASREMLEAEQKKLEKQERGLANLLSPMLPASFIDRFVANMQGNIQAIPSLGANLTSGLEAIPRAAIESIIRGMFDIGAAVTNKNPSMEALAVLSGSNVYMREFLKIPGRIGKTLLFGSNVSVDSSPRQYGNRVSGMAFYNAIHNPLVKMRIPNGKTFKVFKTKDEIQIRQMETNIQGPLVSTYPNERDAAMAAKKQKGTKAFGKEVYKMIAEKKGAIVASYPLPTTPDPIRENELMAEAETEAYMMSTKPDRTHKFNYLVSQASGVASEMLQRVSTATDNAIREPMAAARLTEEARRVGKTVDELLSYAAADESGEFSKYLNKISLAPTYQQDNKMAEYIGKFEAKLKNEIENNNNLAIKYASSVIYILSKANILFYKTPLNLMTKMVDVVLFGTPSLVKSGNSFKNYALAKKEGNKIKQDLYYSKAVGEFASGAVSAMTWVAAYYIVGIVGAVIGSYDSLDEKKRAMLKSRDIPLNSVNISVLKRAQDGLSTEWQEGDKIVPLRMFGMVGQAMMFHASRDARKEKRAIAEFGSGNPTPMSNMLLDEATGILWGVPKQAFDASFMAGVNTLINVVNSGDGNRVADWSRGMTQAVIAGFGVPATYSKAIESQYTPELVDRMDVKGTVENVFRYRTGLEGGPDDKIYDRVDGLGMPVKAQSEGNDPFQVSEYKKTPLWDKLNSIYEQSRDPRVIPMGYRVGNERMAEFENIETYRLVSKDVNYLNSARGAYRRVELEKLFAANDLLLSNGEYGTLDQEPDPKIKAKAVTAAMRSADEMFKPELRKYLLELSRKAGYPKLADLEQYILDMDEQR